MKNIIIADDHDIVRKGVVALLRDEFGKVDVTEADDAQPLINLVQKRDWDLIILDVRLPGRSGLDLLADIRVLAKGVPIIVISAFAEEEHCLRALRSGAAGFLSKSNLAGELPAAIRKVVSGGRYVGEALVSAMAGSLDPERPAERHELLSEREFEVMRLVSLGWDVHQIAEELAIAEKTVNTYRGRVYKKLGVRNPVEIAGYAFRHHLVE